MSDNSIIESCHTFYSKGKERNRECTITLDKYNRVNIFYRKNQMFGRAVAQGIGGIFAREVYSAVTDHGMTYLEDFHVSDIDNIKRSPNPDFKDGWRFYLNDGNAFDITLESDFLNALSQAISKEKSKKTEKKTDKVNEQPKTPTVKAPVFDTSRLPASLRRAFILIEDGEWDKADAYLEKVLDAEPENGYAYLGKLLVSMKLHYPKQLKDILDELKGNKLFDRAYTYANDELRNYLSWIIRSNDPTISTAKTDEKEQPESKKTTSTNSGFESKQQEYKYSDYHEFADYEPKAQDDSRQTGKQSSAKHTATSHVKKQPKKKNWKKTVAIILVIALILTAGFFGKLQIGYLLLDSGYVDKANKLILLDDYTATKFLKGNWYATSDGFFSIEENGTLIDGLPRLYTGTTRWYIANSCLKVETADGLKNDKKIEIISRDKIQVYCFANGQTYTLSRYWSAPTSTQESATKNETNTTYTVTLNKNGGIGGANSATVEFGEPMPEGLEAPSRSGYNFKGYFATTKNNSTQYYTANMKSVHNWMSTTNGELFAQWEKIDNEQGDSKITGTNGVDEDANTLYIVSLNSMGGVNGTGSVKVGYNSPMPEGAVAPKYPGRIFKGYFSKTNGQGIQYYDANMKSTHNWERETNGFLYACWENGDSTESEIYTIKFNNGEGKGTVSTVAVRYGDYLPENIPAPVRDGYTFKGYYHLKVGIPIFYYDENMKCIHSWLSNSDGVLTAQWEKNTDSKQEDSTASGLFYKDKLTGASFTIPVGWTERPLSKERDIVKVKYAADDQTAVIAFGSADFYGPIPASELPVDSRDEFNMSIIPDEIFIEAAATLIPGGVPVRRVQYGPHEYCIFSGQNPAAGGVVSNLTHTVFAYTVENGYMFHFQYGGSENSFHYDEFLKILETARF